MQRQEAEGQLSIIERAAAKLRQAIVKTCSCTPDAPCADTACPFRSEVYSTGPLEDCAGPVAGDMNDFTNQPMEDAHG